MNIALELESVHNSNGMVVCFRRYDPNLQRFHAEIMTKLQKRKNHGRFSQEIWSRNPNATRMVAEIAQKLHHDQKSTSTFQHW